MQAVQIVTIKEKHPLFKGDEAAERIELINLEEVGFDLVAGKDMYQIGDKAIFIQPDFSLSDIPLFESYIRPGGDESKSMLGKIEGKPRRIRAKSFSFSKVPHGDKVYSNGILLPLEEVENYLRSLPGDHYIHDVDIAEVLGITKYEAPEDTTGGLKTGKGSSFPEGIYKTDEGNIYNQIGRINFPIKLWGSLKVDGSSITIGVKNGEGFICSRNMSKPLTYEKVVGVRKKTFLEKVLFWTKPNLKMTEVVENEDDFVKYGKPYLDKFTELGLNDIVFRGELNGGHMKGSGNKNNPARNEPVNIKFFGVDLIVNGVADRRSPETFIEIAETFNLPTTELVFVKEFNSFEEIIQECEAYFKENVVEGIVVRSEDGFSAKVMSLKYDSLK